MRSTFVVAAVAALALGFGCSKNKAVKAMEDWADEVCDCKDAKCAMEVAQKGTKLMKEYADAEGTESDMKAILAAGHRAQDCVKKLSKLH